MNNNVSIKTPRNEKNNIVVGVLFGGRSPEHDISLRSTLYVLKNLPHKYNIIPIGVSREGELFSLEGKFQAADFQNFETDDLASVVSGKSPKSMPHAKNAKSMFYPVAKKKFLPDITENNLRNLNAEISCAFPVLHGTDGEDGRMQSLFELANIPYVGCDRVSSVLCMDKDVQKRLVRDAGIPVADYIAIERSEFNENSKKVCELIEKKIGYPCFVKPNALGSAIGVGKAKNREELLSKLSEALKYDNKALVEELLRGTEIECAFLGTSHNPRVTVPGEISTEDFYSYDEKYSDNSTASLYVPARLRSEQISEVRNFAKIIAKVLGLRGFARIDFWNAENKKKFIFNEVNTIPGLTSISMFPKLWAYEGVDAAQWLEELVENALQYEYK